MQYELREFQQIRDLLAKNPNGMTPRDFAEQLPLCKNTIAKYLAMMHVLGQIDERPIGTTKLYTLSRRVPMENLLDLVSDLISVIDQDLRILQINEKFLDFISLKREELPLGSLEKARVPILSEAYVLSKIQGALNGRKYREEISIEREGGEYRLSLQVVPTMSMQGKPAAAVILQEL
jgi:PAS domain-containing protein